MQIKYNFTKDLIFKLVLQDVPEAAVELAKRYIPNMGDLVYGDDFIINNPMNIEGIELKNTEFDFKFSVSDKLFEYEMQNNKTKYNLKSRILKYYGDLICSSFPKDIRYSHKKCYSLWFISYNIFDNNKTIRTFSLKDEDENTLYDYASITIVEIAKFSEEEYNKDVWKKLFITNDIDSLKGDEVMDKVVKKMWDCNSEEAIAEKLRAEQEWLRGYNSDIEASKAEGKAEGKTEANLETAKKMKNKGLDNSLISEMTGLSIEEINKL